MGLRFYIYVSKPESIPRRNVSAYKSQLTSCYKRCMCGL